MDDNKDLGTLVRLAKELDQQKKKTEKAEQMARDFYSHYKKAEARVKEKDKQFEELQAKVASLEEE